MAANTVRIASYNIEDDINGATTPLPGLYQVLEGIGEEKVQGNVRPIDILGLEETTSNSASVAPIVTALNSYYGGAAVYAQSSYQGQTSGGDVADGNGPNAVVYNTSTLTLLQSVGVGTPGGSSNGEYRQPIRYEFQPVGDTGSNGIFYVYVMHTKSGSTSADAVSRGQEATIVRNNEANLPASASVIYMGDLNSNPPEAQFTNLESPTATNVSGTTVTQGEAYDPLGYPTSPTLVQETDASTKLRYRDDYELMTSNVINDSGNLNYVSGSLHSFANNGSTSTPNSSSNTALNSDLYSYTSGGQTYSTDGGVYIPPSTLYTDVGTASDHLPVVADYTFPSTGVTATPVIGSFTVTPNPVASGANVTFTATGVTETGGSISSVNFYGETNGTSGLQVGSDALIGTGTASGSTYTLTTAASLPAGAYTFYVVATDSSGNTSPSSSAGLAVTGNPTIGSFVANPTTVASGTTFSLTAGSVSDVGSTVTSVAFYMETNGSTGLQTGSDTYLGTGAQSGTSWTLSGISTAGLAAGSYTFYAVATDASSTSSAAASTTLTVTQGAPVIGTFTVSPGSVNVGAAVTLTAIGVTDNGGTITGVNFYRESNGTAGLQMGSDTLIGAGTQNGTTWSTTASTTGLAPGTYTYYAVAADGTGVSSSVASAFLTVYAIPAWLAPSSQAIFNPSTKILTVSGGSTIVGDPGSDEPIITGTAAAAQVAIKPSTNDIDIHIGGVSLTGGAGIDVASIGSTRSHSDHNTLVVGLLNGAAPAFSISSSSKLNLEDNDMIVHNGGFAAVQSLAMQGRNGTVGGFLDGTWTGNGLTSSAAAAQAVANGQEYTALAVVLNGDLPLGSYASWDVGSASEKLSSADVIVKYTYVGDWNLEGAVNDDAQTIFGALFGSTPAQFPNNDDWADASYNGGAVDGDAQTVFGAFFGNGVSNGPQL